MHPTSALLLPMRMCTVFPKSGLVGRSAGRRGGGARHPAGPQLARYRQSGRRASIPPLPTTHPQRHFPWGPASGGRSPAFSPLLRAAIPPAGSLVSRRNPPARGTASPPGHSLPCWSLSARQHPGLGGPGRLQRTRERCIWESTDLGRDRADAFQAAAPTFAEAQQQHTPDALAHIKSEP
jgi:hypothetical protein